MTNAKNYIITALICLLIASLGAFGFIYYQLNNTREEKQLLAVENELLRQNLSMQNEKILSLNKSLEDYNTTIENNRKKYERNLNKAQKQLKEVKSCDDGIKFLKNVLEDIQ